MARLKGLVQNMKPNDESTTTEEVLPTWDVTLPPAPTTPDADALPVGEAVPAAEANPALPLAEPVEAAPPAQAEISAEDVRVAEAVAEAIAPLPSALVAESVGPVPILCPVCTAPRQGDDSCCGDCGYYFSPADLDGAGAERVHSDSLRESATAPAVRLKNRFEIRERISERAGVTRSRGLDYGDGSTAPVPVTIIRQASPTQADALPAAEAIPVEAAPLAVTESDEEVLPVFDDVFPTASPVTEYLGAEPVWPSPDWEQTLLSTLEHPGLPAVLDRFSEDGFDYLLEEVPTGQPLWDAWDDPQADAAKRFGYLAEVADILHRLHQCNAILEGLRPEIIVVSQEGHPRLTDLGDLLPLPLPADVPLRRTLYTAPEVLAGKADARADLYSFGAMLYALHVGRDLNEIDFDRSGTPKPFIPRFPDIHPAFGRLMTKTFRKEVEGRFPTDEAGKEEATGFVELIRTLNTLGRTFDNVRLEIAAWTTIGMVRTGNEDAFALLHAYESRQDDTGEAAMVLLCDGMGGYEAGEVAAALAIQVMRQYLLQQKPFAPLAGASAFPGDVLSTQPRPDGQGHAAPPIQVEDMKKTLKAALKEANKQVYSASRAPARSAGAWAAPPKPSTSMDAMSSSVTSATAALIICTRAVWSS